MIIFLISLTTILTFMAWSLIKAPFLRYSLGVLTLLSLIASVAFLTDHFVNHTGMEVKTTTKTNTIYSAGDSSVAFGLLIYKEVGTSSGNYVLIYRDKKTDKKASAHFVPNTKKIIEAVKKTATYKTARQDEATLTMTTKRYVWKSDLYEWLFGFAGESNELVSQKSVVTVPEDTWLILTQDEAKKLASLSTAMQKQMTTDPTKATTMKALSQSNPKEYAALQVEIVKEALKTAK